MRYELLSTGRGVLTDRTPICGDIKGTYEVPFVLDGGAGYIALLKGADGIEHKVPLKDGVLKVPAALLKDEQFIELAVVETDGEKITREWRCEPLRVTAFIYLRQSQRELSGGLEGADALTRLAELERTYAAVMTELAEHKRTAATAAQGNADLCDAVEALTAKLTAHEAHLTPKYDQII